MEKVAQWVYEKCDLIINDQVALQTDTGIKKLNMSAESWPSNVCREIMDCYPEILKEAIPDWDGENKELHQRCSDAWLNFTWLADLISMGCNINVEAWDAHGAELDASRKDVMTSFIAVNTRQACRSPYLHGPDFHLWDMVRRWGSLNQFSSQACESLHQWIKTFAIKFSNKKEWVRTTCVSVVVRQRVEQSHKPARRSQCGGKKRATTCHMGNPMLEKHTTSKDVAIKLKL